MSKPNSEKTEPRVIARRVEGLLTAMGWDCETSAGGIKAIEPAFKPIEHTFLAGNAVYMTEDDIVKSRPEIVITEDEPPSGALTRVKECIKESNASSELTTVSRFIDSVWEAERAAISALKDSETPEDAGLLSGLSVKGSNPQERHVDQTVIVGNEPIRDIDLLENAFTDDSGILVVMADAGLGKSELLRLLEWRGATNYLNATRRGATGSLPALPLRVRLRGLQTLTMDALASRLAEPTKADGFSLRKISSGEILAQLCVSGRVVLLLDGLDEFGGPPERMEAGLDMLKLLAADGGHTIVATRPGASLPLHTHLDAHPRAAIKQLTDPAADKLLKQYGATQKRSESIRGFLPEEVVGIPLFLLLALASQNSAPLADEATASKTTILLELIRRFCERDWSRTELPADMQISLLQQIAHWTSMIGRLSRAEALEYLSLQASEKEARLVNGPHGLLTYDGDSLSFRHPQFLDVLLAKALWSDWDFHSHPSGDFQKLRLPSETTEHLSQLVPDDGVRQAWLTACDGQGRSNSLFRRNLLAIAISKLQERNPAGSHRERATSLQLLLGNADLADMNFHGLVLERLDLDSWDLRRIRGREGQIRYCKLNGARFDSSLQNLESLEGSEVPTTDDESSSRVNEGRKKLTDLLNRCLNRRVEPPALIPEIATARREAPDFWQMKILRGEGWVELKQNYRGLKFWVWTEKGRHLAISFLADPTQSDEAYEGVLFKIGS